MKNDKIIDNVINKYSQKEEVQEFSKLVKIGLYNFEERFIDMHLKPKIKILNLGGGGGREAIALEKKGFEIISIDISFKMCYEILKNRYRYDSHINVIQMNAINLGFFDSQFDSCIALGQLIAWIPKRENRIQMLRECKRVLKPGGILIFSTHSRKYKLKYKLYFFFINPLRKIKKFLGFKNVLEPNDRFAKQVSAVKSKGKCFLHHYSLNEAIEDIKLSGLKPLICRGTYELLNNIEDERKREKSYLLFFSAIKE